MSENTQQLHEPTVDDLRVKLCYICLKEEHYDSLPDPPTVWIRPCKCTLIVHESCLLHWINTQQRDFGSSWNEFKCPYCHDLLEFVDHRPTVLQLLSFVHRALSRSDSIVTWLYVSAIVFLSCASVYLTCATYGAFAVREFLGPDMFNTLLTANPTLWPRHAWANLPLIPFSLITTCIPFLWTTDSLVPLVLWISPLFLPLLSPWPTSPPVEPPVACSGGTRHPVYSVSLLMWPPPPALLCALFPYIRLFYEYLRTRVTRALVHGHVPARRQPNQVVRQEQPRRRDPQEPLQRPRQRQQGQRQQQEEHREQQQQERQQRQEPQEQPNDNDFGARAAALAIRVMNSSLGRLICGALVVPTIARMMGAILLNISHVVPFVGIIIAARPPPPPPLPLPPPPPPTPPATTIGGLLGLWDCARDCVRSTFGLRVSGRDNTSTADIRVRVVTGGDDDKLSEFSTTILSGFLATSQEWATSDPVWWRNALGLCVFLVVKDGLEILHLRLANAQLERRIKSKPFSDIDLTMLDLIERHT